MPYVLLRDAHGLPSAGCVLDVCILETWHVTQDRAMPVLVGAAWLVHAVQPAWRCSCRPIRARFNGNPSLRGGQKLISLIVVKQANKSLVKSATGSD